MAVETGAVNVNVDSMTARRGCAAIGRGSAAIRRVWMHWISALAMIAGTAYPAEILGKLVRFAGVEFASENR